MLGSSNLFDTNILFRLVQPGSPEYGTIRQYTDRLWARGAELFRASQDLAEFWNVCTRPPDRNGFGFSVAETDERTALIEPKFSLAAESEGIHQQWRRIVVASKVSGIEVRDARLIAAMHVHEIGNLRTLNVKDSRRFSGVAVPSPREVLATLG